MRGINKVILIGTAGKDPVSMYTADGRCVTSVSIATNNSWTDKVTGEKKEHTEWHKLVFYAKLAEISGEYLKKGSKVYVEGSLKTRKYTDKEGVVRYSTEVEVREMQMLGGGEAPALPAEQAQPAHTSGRNQDHFLREDDQQQPQQRPQQQQAVHLYDDDIPF